MVAGSHDSSGGYYFSNNYCLVILLLYNILSVKLGKKEEDSERDGQDKVEPWLLA